MPLDASFQSASFTFAGQICWPIDLGHCRDIAKAWDFITRRNMFWEKRLVARFWKMVFWHRFLFHVFPLFNIFCLLSVAIFSRGFTLQPSTWQRTQWKSVVPEFYWIYMKASENSSKFRSPSSPSNISREHATASHSTSCQSYPSVPIQCTVLMGPLLTTVVCGPQLMCNFAGQLLRFEFWRPTSQFYFLSSIRFAVVPANSSYGYLFILPASPSICAIQGCHIPNSMLMHWMMYIMYISFEPCIV